MRRAWLLAVALMAAPSFAAAEEPSGCGGFKWLVEHERAALANPDKQSVANGGALAFGAAASLKLAPLAEAGLPSPPERAPKSQRSFAGHFTLAAPAKPGMHKITMSSAAWIDVIDGGRYLHPAGFAGATDCEGARKSVKFDLPARPTAIQFSGAADGEISVIVTPAD
jgi:hypothetical protein